MMRTRPTLFFSYPPCQKFPFNDFNPYRRHASAASFSAHHTPIYKILSNVPAAVRNVSNSSPSTVHVGTSYEHLCLNVLGSFGFSLTRTGGKSDKGIDLLGVWQVPVNTPSGSPLRVVIQCKAYTGQVYPALIRELEGAVAGAPGAWRSEDTIGVLCAPKGATGGIRDAMRMAERGIVWVTVEEVEGGKGDMKVEGRVAQFLWNESVRKVVKNGLGAGLRYIPGAKRMEQEVVLMLHGRVWEPESTVKREENAQTPLEGYGGVGETTNDLG